MQSPDLPPVVEFGWVTQHIQAVSLVVAFKAHHLARLASFNQKLERLAGIGAAVDIIAEIDFDWTLHRVARDVHIDHREHLL